jgi:hypothetical protein
LDLPPGQSAEASAFCSALLDTWQQQQKQQQRFDVVLNSCLLIGHLAAKCSLLDQRQLLLPACAWISQAAAATADTTDVDAGPSDQPVCLALPVLAAARPGLLSAASAVDVVQALARLASSSSSSSNSWIDSTAAGVALAGIINKSLGVQNQQQRKGGTEADPTAAAGAAAGVQAGELLAAAIPILTQPLQQQQQGTDGTAAAAAANAVKASAWIARGLAQQRHNSWQDLMQQYILPALQLGTAVQEQPGSAAAAAAVPSELVWAAAHFFAVLVAPVQPQAATASSSSSSSSSTVIDAFSLGHALSLHNMARPLWQQKVFVLALHALQSAVASTAGVTVLEPHQQQQRQEQGLWLAVASLVSAAPAALAAAEQQHMLLLLQCVVHLAQIWEAVSANSSSPAVTAAVGSEQQVMLLQLLHSCLLMLGDALSSNGAAAEAELGQHVELLLQTLCKLAQVQPMNLSITNLQQQQQQQHRRQTMQLAANLREVAVMCLTSCMSVPYHLLHPHRRSVLAAVMVALDDDRRAVRKAAVACRGVWSSS